MTYIKAEAEDLLTRLGVESVDVVAGFRDIRAGTLDIPAVDASEEVLKADRDAVLLRRRHKCAVKCEVKLFFLLLRENILSIYGVNDYVAAIEEVCDGDRLLRCLKHEGIHVLVASVDPEREGSVHLCYLYPFSASPFIKFRFILYHHGSLLSINKEINYPVSVDKKGKILYYIVILFVNSKSRSIYQ